MTSLKSMLATVGTVIVLTGCGSSKSVSNPPAVNQSMQKLAEIECQQIAEQRPDIRAWGSGVSFDEMKARNYAMLQARSEFAKAIASKVIAATSQGGTDYEKASTDGSRGAMVRDESKISNDDAIAVAENVVKNAVVIKTERFMLNDGSYKVYVCLEYREGVGKLADAIARGVEQRISDDERLKMQFDLDQFRKRYEEKLEQMREERKY